MKIRLAIIAGMLFALFYAQKAAALVQAAGYSIKAAYFPAAEFGPWWNSMDTLLVAGLNEFGRRVEGAGGFAYISPHPDALGRLDGSTTSQHYAGDGDVTAADIMIEGITLAEAHSIALGMEFFSGIGLYPDTQPAPMIHLDTRTDKTPDNPALWSRINGNYVGIEAALV